MVTLKNVAEQAGVSTATVSFVLNGRGKEMKISEPCSDRVIKAAQELGYRKHFYASALSTGKTATIGFVLSWVINDRMWSSVMRGVQQGVQQCAKDLIIIGRGPDGENPFRRGVQYLQDHRVDGLVVAGRIPLDFIPDSVAETEPPIVSLSGEVRGSYPSVSVDPVPGIRDAIEYLSNLGHSDVLYISKGKGDNRISTERIEAFRKHSAARGLQGRVLDIAFEHDYFPELSRHIEHNIHELNKKLELKNETAIMCYNDTVGLGIYHVLRERGIRIPDDISVIGFDDLHAANVYPGMTTVSHMFEQMGVKAVETVQQLIDGRNEIRGMEIRIPSELVIRKSTAVSRNK